MLSKITYLHISSALEALRSREDSDMFRIGTVAALEVVMHIVIRPVHPLVKYFAPSIFLELYQKGIAAPPPPWYKSSNLERTKIIISEGWWKQAQAYKLIALLL